METDILVGIIGGIGAVLSASIPYYLSKKNEIAATLKKNKLARYDELLKTCSMLLEADNEESVKQFVSAYNRASAYTPKEVIDAINDFITWKENGSKKIPDDDLIKGKDPHSMVFKAIHDDVNPKEPIGSFRVLDPKVLSRYF